VLLPCNVVVRAADAGGDATIVEAVDPDLLMRHADHVTLHPIAREARAKLAAALETVEKCSLPAD